MVAAPRVRPATDAHIEARGMTALMTPPRSRSHGSSVPIGASIPPPTSPGALLRKSSLAGPRGTADLMNWMTVVDDPRPPARSLARDQGQIQSRLPLDAHMWLAVNTTESSDGSSRSWTASCVCWTRGAAERCPIATFEAPVLPGNHQVTRNPCLTSQTRRRTNMGPPFARTGTSSATDGRAARDA